MATKFEEIKIVALDDKASYKSEQNTQMTHFVLTLSATTPSNWANYFNHLWKQHIYMLKRNASVSGASLEIYCPPSELQEHITELNKVIAETNTAYGLYIQKSQIDAAERAAAKARDQAELTDLKSKLNFDV